MKKIEILAPAGSKDSFTSAVEAGADAVYCGLESFSARSKAENFTPSELYNYTNYAHSKNVKVYAAFNTLIKQTEIQEAVKQINFIANAGADALIVQDFGIVNIVHKHFPNLKLHASTQMAIHNSYGALQAKEFGFQRVVLARELSSAEIKEISRKAGIELEVFCHGALCYCVSGLCLMSSFIGGLSGNRGGCAQPCRRKWSFKDKDGFYLSPKDLEFASNVNELKKAGVTSLKIEGRMKNPQYVYKAVKAYKMLADAEDDNFAAVLKEAQEILLEDFARPKTSFNFNSKSDDIFNPEMPKQLGINLGKVLSAASGKITLKTDFKINKGDLLKAADASKDVYFKFRINKISDADSIYTLETDSSFLKAGMEIFKTSDSEFGVFLSNIINNVKIEKAVFDVKPKEIKMPFIKPSEPKEELFIRVDNAAWLKDLPTSANAVFALGKDNLPQAVSLKNINYFELPAYIEEMDLPVFQSAINELSKNKKNSFILNNISHFNFFKKGTKLEASLGAKLEASLLAGQFLYCMNSFAADFLFKKNIKGFTFGWEEDLKNITELSKSGLGGYGIFYLSGLPALAVSKMKTHKDLITNETLNSAKDTFQIVHKNNSTFVLPQYPVMLFNKKQQLLKLKISKFAIDLSFTPPNKNYLAALISAYGGKLPLQNDFEFNFERGLK